MARPSRDQHARRVALSPLARALEVVDHLVIAAPDLGAAVDAFERATGARAAAGGRHPRWGTHNALLALGDTTYLEIIAPDPDRAAAVTPRIFGVDRVRAPRLAAWAVRADDIDAAAARAAQHGVALGEVLDGSRERPDGRSLAWRLTDPETVVLDGVVPFLIAWSSDHPARDAPSAGRLAALRVQHPRPEHAARALRALGIDVGVDTGARPALVATLETARGPLELR